MPAIAVIALSFVAVVALMRLKVPLWAAMIGGIIVIAIAVRQSLAEGANGLLTTVRDPQTISLVIIIALILLLSELLDASGRLHDIVDRFQRVLNSRRLRLAAFPALIGLLPMPGGAVFSAPMVKAAGSELDLPRYQLASINYWFRHIWEFWWPLYPGVILTIGLTNLSLPLFMAAQFPLTPVAVGIGTLTLFAGLPRKHAENENRESNAASPRANGVGAALMSLWPILVVVIGGVGLQMVLEFAASAGYQLQLPLPRMAIIGALFVVCVLLAVIERKTILRALQGWGSRRNVEMVFMIVAVLWYKLLLEQSGLVRGTVDEFASWHVPLVAVLLILPFIAGLITGIQMAALGVSLPVCIGLAQSAGIPLLPAAVFAYSAALMGVMASPIHFCFFLTKDYFEERFAPMYRLIAPGIVTVLVAAALLAMLYEGMTR